MTDVGGLGAEPLVAGSQRGDAAAILQLFLSNIRIFRHILV